MNTFGKILAVCNFLIAIAVVAFVGLVFATRTNWKQYADDREKENIVIKSAREQDAQTNNKLNLEITGIRAAKEKSDNELKGLKEDKEAELKAKDLQIAELNRTITERDVKKGVDLSEIERLKEEVTGLLGTLNKRQKEIVKLQEQVKEEQTKAIQNKNEAATFISRNTNLLAEINRLNVLLQEMQNKVAGGGTLPNPSATPTPPIRPASPSRAASMRSAPRTRPWSRSASAPIMA